MKRTLLIGLLLAAHSGHAAGTVNDAQAVKAIMGEGANQNYRAMLGIASAIRNRGTLHGVYGLNNLTAQKSSSAVWARAQKAWHESATNNIVAGCKHFGCPGDESYFLNTLHFHAVAKIGDITFYKP